MGEFKVLIKCLNSSLGLASLSADSASSSCGSVSLSQNSWDHLTMETAMTILTRAVLKIQGDQEKL